MIHKFGRPYTAKWRTSFNTPYFVAALFLYTLFQVPLSCFQTTWLSIVQNPWGNSRMRIVLRCISYELSFHRSSASKASRLLPKVVFALPAS